MSSPAAVLSRAQERWLRPIRDPATVAELAIAATACVMLAMTLLVLPARRRLSPLPAAPASSTAGGELGRGSLLYPVPSASLTAMSDGFKEPRGRRAHEAVDILAPRGSAVVAVADGTVARLSRSKAGGISIYQLDAAGRHSFFYAHLDRYADGLAVGQPLKRGQVIGYVGTTGNAPRNTPHLHFAISEVAAQRQWWGGRPIDPFPLWR